MTEEMQYAVLHELVEPARRNLPRGTWDYLMGGAETETTQERNRVALDSLAFRPRVLRDVEKVDAGGKVLGHSLTLPVILAPIGSLQDMTAGPTPPRPRPAVHMRRNHARCSNLGLVSLHSFRFTSIAGHCGRHRSRSQTALAPYPARPRRLLQVAAGAPPLFGQYPTVDS